MSGTNGQNGNNGAKPSENKVARPQNKHLIPIKPGECRNPKGRPKGSVDIWARVRAKLREKAKQGPNAGKRYADLVAASIVKAAVKGRWPQTKELLDREHGKPADNVTHEISGPNGAPIEVSHVFDADRFTDLYRRRTGRDPTSLGSAPSNGN